MTENGPAPASSYPESTSGSSARRPWIRTLAIALVAVVALGVASGVATRFVHSGQAVSSVSCLDSTCTSGMGMSPSMEMSNESRPKHATHGSMPAPRAQPAMRAALATATHVPVAAP